MARRGGLFGFLASTVGKIIDAVTPNREPEPGNREPPPDNSGGDSRGGDYTDSPTGNDSTVVTDADNPPGQDRFPFDFALAGFVELDTSPKTDWVNLEGEPVYLDYLPWENIDYFVVKVQEPGKDPYYTTISGTFYDYDDLLDHIEQWWEEGS